MACNNSQIGQKKSTTEDYRQLNIENIDFSYISSIQSVKYTLPFSKYLFENTDEIPEFSKSATHSFLKSKNNIQTLVYYSYQLLNASAGGFGPPLQNTKKQYKITDENQLAEQFELHDLEINTHSFNQWNKLPFNLKKDIVELVISMQEAKYVFDQFANPVKKYLAKKSALNTNEIFENLIIPWENRELADFSSIDVIQQVDLKKLACATRIVSGKLQQFTSNANTDISEGFTHCIIKSEFGDILINGCENDTIADNFALIVELGGDDLYLGNTASSVSINKPVGIVVDFSGNDKYICKNNYLVSGILGIGVLLDLKGDDHYENHKSGLAFSLYGSSLLYDFSGNDTYISKSKYSQAASCVGSSVLIDLKGDDNYISESYSQAFASTLGVSVLIDCEGDDFYNAKSHQNFTTSALKSFMQGSSKGRWAEATDGQSIAGGIGLFIDNSGNDKHGAQSFSQGASYYFGLGLFNDISGNDEYNAISHSQGYAAHFALAGFFENKGNDTYNAKTDTNKITQIIGGGRDFSAGWFIDKEGDDYYHFGNRSVGIGDINGLGVFVDLKGKDTYFHHKNKFNSGSKSMGKITGLNQAMDIGFRIYKPNDCISQGVFIDNYGTNKFY